VVAALPAMAEMKHVPHDYASAGTVPRSERRFSELLHEFDTATVITRARTGSLHGRPMAVADVEENGTLWFITNVDSPKVLEVRDDSRAMISLQSPRQFLTMNGHLELVADRDKVDQIWKDTYRVWFDREADPELVLLRFTPFDAEYWDNSGTHELKREFDAATSYIRAQRQSRPSRSETSPEARAR
jgi:general stress protein 26